MIDCLRRSPVCRRAISPKPEILPTNQQLFIKRVVASTLKPNITKAFSRTFRNARKSRCETPHKHPKRGTALERSVQRNIQRRRDFTQPVTCERPIWRMNQCNSAQIPRRPTAMNVGGDKLATQPRN